MLSSQSVPNVLVLSGSTRSPTSYTRTLSRAIGDSLEAAGASVTHWDAGTPMLPIADPAHHTSASTYPDPLVQKLDRVAIAADAFVFATPVYHNSYSGVLKNIIDLLNIRPHFSYKPVGLVSHGGDRSAQAVDHLRIVARGLNAIAIPTHVCTRKADYREVGQSYEVTDLDIVDRINRFVSELVAMTVLIRPLRDPVAMDDLLSAVKGRATSS